MFGFLVEEVGVREIRGRFEEFVGAVGLGVRKVYSVMILPDLPHSHKGGNTICALKFVGGAGPFNLSKSRSDTRYSPRLDHLEVFSGINERREPVVREDVRGNLLPNVVGRQ